MAHSISPPATHLPSVDTWPTPRADAASGNDARWLTPLLLLWVLKGVLLVAMIGPFTGHDEVDHFWYIVRLAEGNGLGVVGEVNLPPEAEPYRAYVADYPTNAEVIQPPLYHLLLAPISLLAPDDPTARLTLLRLVSIPIGAGVVVLAYLIARLLFPDNLLIRAGVPVVVAMQPQVAFEGAIVNHDILLILLVCATLYLTLVGLRDGFSPERQWLIGLIGGAGFWTKVSFGLVLPVVALALILVWRRTGKPWRALVPMLLRSIGLPLLLIVPWFVRSWWLYNDPTGASRLREIPEYGEQAQALPEMLFSTPFWRQMIEDFWGNYGWRQIPLEPMVIRVIWVAWGLTLLGLAAGLARRWLPWRSLQTSAWSTFQRQGVAMLALSILLYISGVLYVGTIQFTQARFAFPAMVGVAMLALLGVQGWLPVRWRPYALPAVFVILMALNTVVMLRFLIPFYYGPGGGAMSPP